MAAKTNAVCWTLPYIVKIRVIRVKVKFLFVVLHNFWLVVQREITAIVCNHQVVSRLQIRNVNTSFIRVPLIA